MQNLRVISISVVDSTTIKIKFSHELDPAIGVTNFVITSDAINVPSPVTQKVAVSGDTATLTVQPLTQLSAYFIQFISTTTTPFKSKNGDAIMPNDGVSNKQVIIGAPEPSNPVREYLQNFFRESIYDLDDDNTVVSKIVHVLSIALEKALYDIRQVKNENYISYQVTDERKVRGSGPFDRLNEEAAYEVLRVGRSATDAIATDSFSFAEFPSCPVTLKRLANNEILTIDSENTIGKFNINELIINLSKKPITKLNKVTFTLVGPNPVYEYNIEKLGYRIKDSKYDPDYGFNFVTLEDNQIKLNDDILADPNFLLNSIVDIRVEYEYKNLGRVIDAETVVVSAVLPAVREVLPPIINVFNLKHAPIVGSSGNVASIGGVTFRDPNVLFPSQRHPAFITEVPFSFHSMPARPGEYSVDYASGTVYVYGADAANDGTGPYPPLATYKYKLTYTDELDYVYDEDFSDLVALPYGNLIENTGTISFSYEEVLVPGVDYNSNPHVEVLNERVNNRLLALNAVRAEKSPITNVFRIFNETTGEIYNLSRWHDDKIYFTYTNAPRINTTVSERATFHTQVNELLFVNSTLFNTSSLKVFKILLDNNNVIAGTEDSIGSSINSSFFFNNINVFMLEKWFDRTQDETVNIDRLTAVGQYTIDYINGIVYVAVSSTQGTDIGAVSYKINSISPTNPHIITVNDIYYRISSLSPKNKNFTYSSFDDGEINPLGLEPSDEMFKFGNDTLPYQIFNNSVGVIDSLGFVPGVTSSIKFLNGVYELDDLRNNNTPYNFATGASFNNNTITLSNITNVKYDLVEYDGSDYYIYIPESFSYLSPNITFDISIIRQSDSAQLWDNAGTIVTGSELKLVLSGTNAPVAGDAVVVTYTISANNLSRVIVNYNRGDFFIDYSYLADEILISYEYGDNVLDFRQNNVISTNTEYYVTYKVGALRDALLKNFGTLINIPELANFNIDLDRERYRDALSAGLESFIQGPTVKAISHIVEKISHVPPEIIESAFQNWSLGSSFLNPRSIETEGEFALLPAKHGNGVLVNNNKQRINAPYNSNLRLEGGSFESWVIPNWNGIDNDAKLTFTIKKNGQTIKPFRVFIGAIENHPIFDGNSFTLDKNHNVFGKPNKNKDGVYVYYDKDQSGDFFRWYIDFVDGYTDGYVEGLPIDYNVVIKTTGDFYDVKSTILPRPSNMTTTTRSDSLTIRVVGGTTIDQGITFVSDEHHYLLDVGEKENRNRLSIYKDSSGYLVFKVFDKFGTPYFLSADVSSWKMEEMHHVAASWKLNTKNNRDEMHLFIDGFEVPNILRYGQKLQPYLHEKFRTVNPEEIIGLANRDIVGSIDLVTTAGSNQVISSLNFSNYNVFNGDSIIIEEIGFDPAGYTITNINGNTLTLSSVMPLTITNGRYSINKSQYSVTSEIDIVPNFAVTRIPAFLSGTDLTINQGSATVTSTAIDFDGYDVLPGFLIHIDGYDMEPTYTILNVSTNTLVLNGELPSTDTNVSFTVYAPEEEEIPGLRALSPSYSISKDGYYNNLISFNNNVYEKDLLLIRTLGMNNRRIRKKYYVWSDNQENVLKTRLPAPISLDETKIFKIIVPDTAITPNNSTVLGNQFTSNNISGLRTSNSQFGRTLAVEISGTNVDFTNPVEVHVTGQVGVATVTETLTFNDYGTIDTTNLFIKVDYIVVEATATNPARSVVNVEVKEKYTITRSEASGMVPKIRYSYQMNVGTTLEGDGYTVRDENQFFSSLVVGNILLIHSPISVAGFYKITGVSSDFKSLTIESTIPSWSAPLPNFTGATYQVLNITDYRTGLQNGYFVFQQDFLVGSAYFLSHGWYEFDYNSYMIVKMDPMVVDMSIGHDFKGTRHFKGVINEVKTTSNMMTDTRVGEFIPSKQRSITKDFNSLKALKKDVNTLMLVSFDSYPFTNNADFYIGYEDKQFVQVDNSINDNFAKSVVVTDKPIILDNEGILDNKKEGTIEFWVSPIYDTANDPQDRFYFDANSAMTETVTSEDYATVRVAGNIGQVLKVTVQGNPAIDYFAGGKVELDTRSAVRENAVSLNSGSVIVSKDIFQVISVKIANDSTNKDYFIGGAVAKDKRTIYLGTALPQNTVQLVVTYRLIQAGNDVASTQVIRLNRRLPNHKTSVVVSYIPKGLQGDRISIFKDTFGYLNFNVHASGLDYMIRAPIYWAKHTWHRVKASYKFNNVKGNDEIKLFIDGYERGDILYGSGFLYGQPVVYGSSFAGNTSLFNTIKFKDPINQIFIGSSFTRESPAYAAYDNLRISNVFRPVYAPFGESLDINYNSNIGVVFPVTEDLYTTYLMNYETTLTRTDDFVVLKNKKSGIFDFSINVFDSFDILQSDKVKNILEKLVKTLKPANSRVFINYE